MQQTIVSKIEEERRKKTQSRVNVRQVAHKEKDTNSRPGQALLS